MCTAREQYTLVDRSLNIGAVAIVDLGSPAATYQTTLIRRDGSQFLVRESFTNDKRVLMVELRPGRLTGTVVSIHQDLMAVDASGAPGWTGVKVLNSGIVIDDGFWDRVFEITYALPSRSLSVRVPDWAPSSLSAPTGITWRLASIGCFPRRRPRLTLIQPAWAPRLDAMNCWKPGRWRATRWCLRINGSLMCHSRAPRGRA